MKNFLIFLLGLAVGLLAYFGYTQYKKIIPVTTSNEMSNSNLISSGNNVALKESNQKDYIYNLPILEDTTTTNYLGVGKTNPIVSKVLIPTYRKTNSNKDVLVGVNLPQESVTSSFVVKKPITRTNMSVYVGGDSVYVIYDPVTRDFVGYQGEGFDGKLPFIKKTSKYKTYYEGGQGDGGAAGFYAIYDYSSEYFLIIQAPSHDMGNVQGITFEQSEKKAKELFESIHF